MYYVTERSSRKENIAILLLFVCFMILILMTSCNTSDPFPYETKAMSAFNRNEITTEDYIRATRIDDSANTIIRLQAQIRTNGI